MNKTYANLDVLEFYKQLPFNYKESIDAEVERVRTSNTDNLYPQLTTIIDKTSRVLEVGCGTGWLSNMIANILDCSVTGIDFNPVAIERAREVARVLNLETQFQVGDLFLYEPAQLFDVVISFGVLHHTDNCHYAIQRICRSYVRPGGFVLIGLYHLYGRQPFLDHFQEMKKAGVTEETLYARYKQLHSSIKDETHLRSWFRDQVLHPHETQHTLKEMVPLLEGEGMKLLSTSINGFAPIDSVEPLFDEELKFRDIAVKKLEQNKYFPGFYIFLAKKL
jgi:2-polyprenyl-3-methyl-5-hydroxy-6-metoxy-1,4-benzoquinol methylase